MYTSVEVEIPYVRTLISMRIQGEYNVKYMVLLSKWITLHFRFWKYFNLILVNLCDVVARSSAGVRQCFWYRWIELVLNLQNHPGTLNFFNGARIYDPKRAEVYIVLFFGVLVMALTWPPYEHRKSQLYIENACKWP